MPFYEYECSSCKFYTELMQKITDAPLTKCPSCGKKTMTKLVSAPVFRLKGAGWYETDFKSDKEGKRNLAGADEAPKSEPAAASASSGEAPKTEAKADAGASKPTEAKPAASATASSPSRGPRAVKPSARPAPSTKKARAASPHRGRATSSGGKAHAAAARKGKVGPARKKGRR